MVFCMCNSTYHNGEAPPLPHDPSASLSMHIHNRIVGCCPLTSTWRGRVKPLRGERWLCMTLPISPVRSRSGWESTDLCAWPEIPCLTGPECVFLLQGKVLVGTTPGQTYQLAWSYPAVAGWCAAKRTTYVGVIYAGIFMWPTGACMSPLTLIWSCPPSTSIFPHPLRLGSHVADVTPQVPDLCDDGQPSPSE